METLYGGFNAPKCEFWLDPLRWEKVNVGEK
jgi:hypothetical protein